MKTIPAILISLSGATLLFLAYKSFNGKKLLGSANSGILGTKQVSPPVTDEQKLAMAAKLSTLNAQLQHLIPSEKTDTQLKDEINLLQAQIA